MLSVGGDNVIPANWDSAFVPRESAYSLRIIDLFNVKQGNALKINAAVLTECLSGPNELRGEANLI
jgi:hypothetical protein